MDDRTLSEPLLYTFSANRGELMANLAGWRWWHLPEALLWATEIDVIYKGCNVLSSRSLLAGEVNWVFGPGGSSNDGF